MIRLFKEQQTLDDSVNEVGDGEYIEKVGEGLIKYIYGEDDANDVGKVGGSGALIA